MTPDSNLVVRKDNLSRKSFSHQKLGSALADFTRRLTPPLEQGGPHPKPPYRSVKATSNELKTGLNIYRRIDFEPV